MLKPSKNKWLHFDSHSFHLKKTCDGLSSSITSCNPSFLRALLLGSCPAFSSA